MSQAAKYTAIHWHVSDIYVGGYSNVMERVSIGRTGE